MLPLYKLLNIAIGLTSFVVFPICLSALFYLIWFLFAFKQRFLTYWKLFGALLFASFTSLFAEHYTIKLIPGRITNDFSYMFLFWDEASNNIYLIKALSTFLYTWQMHELLIYASNPY